MQPWEIVVLICLLTLCCTMSYVSGRLHQQLKDDKDELNQLRKTVDDYNTRKDRAKAELNRIYGSDATYKSQFIYRDTDDLWVKEEKNEKH